MTVTLPSGRALRVPTAEEMLRVRAFLVLERNQVRDFLDVVALAERLGRDDAAVIDGLDRYRGPAPRLPDWAVVVGASPDLAAMLAGDA